MSYIYSDFLLANPQRSNILNMDEEESAISLCFSAHSPDSLMMVIFNAPVSMVLLLVFRQIGASNLCTSLPVGSLLRFLP